MASCGKCVRVRLAVPEAAHHLTSVPGFTLGEVHGRLAEGIADAGAVERLRQHRLVKGVQVLGQGSLPPERLEPLAASLLNGLVELLRQPAVMAALLLLLLGGTLRRSP
jgi:hypothetical protein